MPGCLHPIPHRKARGDTIAELLIIPPIRLETQTGKTILNTPELKLRGGKAYIFIGPSGSGKSLFLRSLFGWTAPDLSAIFHPTQGQYYLLQDPGLGLTQELTIGGHFREIGITNPNSEKLQNLLEVLYLNIPKLFSRKPRALSGGERQRIMLALILVQDPRVLVCDEPAASLDDTTQKALWDYLFQQQTDRGLTLLIATHRYHLIKHPIEGIFSFSNGEIPPPKQVPTPHCIGNIHLLPRQDSEASVIESCHEGLRATRVHISFGKISLLENASIHLEPGRTFWLTGISGAGKTTLAKLLAGLAGKQKGELKLHDEPLESSFPRRKKNQKRAIFYLYQHGTESFNPCRPIGDQLEEAFANHLPDLTQMIRGLRLDTLDLSQTPDHFSIGELQRLNLIRCLSQRPAFLIADELLAPLDGENQAAVLSLLALCQRMWRTGILIVGHDISHLPLLPGPVYKIQDRRLIRCAQ